MLVLFVFSLAVVFYTKSRILVENRYSNMINHILTFKVLMTLYMIKAATRCYLHGDSA